MALFENWTPEQIEEGKRLRIIPQDYVSHSNPVRDYLTSQVPPQEPPPVAAPVPSSPVAAPVVVPPKESGFDWGSIADAIGVGLSGIGDAYSAAAGRSTNFGQNALNMVQNKQKLEREQQETALKRKRAQDTLFKLTGKHFENADEIMANSEILKSLLPKQEEKKQGKTKVAVFDPVKKTFTDLKGNVLTEVDPSVYEIKESKEAPNGKDVKNLTEGEKARDRDFARDYNDFISQGGYADVQKSLNQLSGVSSDLEKTSIASGGIVGLVPKFGRDIFLRGDLQDTVEEIVQRNLKLVLGGQFTEKEGEMLMKRTFNPLQTEKENKKRVDRLIGQIKEAAAAKQAAAEYFDEHGTLKGFKGRLYNSANDFLSDEGKDEKIKIVSTEAEALALPIGTRFSLNGKIGTVQ